MSLTVNAKTYTADSLAANSIGYAGPAHTFSLSDYIRIGRTAPKPTTQISGVGRVTSNLNRTVPLTGALTTTGALTVKIEVSVPVGFAGADVDSALNDMGSHLASASFKLMAKNSQINF